MVFHAHPCECRTLELCQVQSSYFWQCPGDASCVLMTKSDWPPWGVAITRGQIIERTRRTLTRYTHERFMTGKGYTAPGTRRQKATSRRPGTPEYSFQNFLSVAQNMFYLRIMSCQHGYEMSVSRKIRHKFTGRYFISWIK